MFQMLNRQIKEGVVLKELVIVIDLGRYKITLPVLLNVGGNRILQGNHQVHIFALDSNHELVGGTESLVRFFKCLYARRIFGQQVRKVGIKLKARLKENGNCAKERHYQIKSKRLILVLTN